MTDQSDKLRALFLSALMVLSVFGGTIALSGSVAAVANAPAYEDAIGLTATGNSPGHLSVDNNDVAIEVTFNQSVQSSSVATQDFRVVFDSKAGNSNIYQFPNAIEDNDGDKALILEFNSLNQAITNVSHINVTDVGSGDGQIQGVGAGSATNPGNQSVTVTTTDVAEGDSDTSAWRGEKVAVVGDNPNENIWIERGDTNDLILDGQVGNDGQVLVFRTKNRDLAEYGFAFDDSEDVEDPAATNLTLRNLQLEAFVDDATIDTDDELQGNVTARGGNRDVVVTMEDPKGNEFDRRLTLDGTGVVEWNFGDPDNYEGRGNYSFSVKDVGTGNEVDANQEIQVAKADKAKADFDGASLFQDDRGDVVNITIGLSDTDTATVALGSGDVGYSANITVEDGNDDDEVILQWNTYAAGPSNSGTLSSPGTTSNVAFSVAATPSGDDPDELTVINITSTISGGPGDVVEAGDYPLEIRGGDSSVPKTVGAQEVATISLSQRSTNGVRIHSAPGSRIDDLDSKSALYQHVRNGNVTRDRTVAGSDALIVEIDATGIEGAILDQSGNSFTDQFITFVNGSNRPASMTINQTSSETNKVQKILNINDTEEVIDDSNNDTYFVIIDTDTVGVARDDGNNNGRFDAQDSSSSLKDNNQFEANFTVLKNKDGLAKKRQTVRQNWEFVDAEAEVNAGGDTLLVSSAANQSVSGTTTVAAGTELTIRAESAESGTPFLMTRDVFVEKAQGSQNTWSTEFDFSGIPTGTNFTVDVQRSGNTLLDEDQDGRVAAAPQASVTFNNQDSDGEIVTVQSVTMNRGGFVAIHFRTASGPVIGTSKLLSPGTHTNVRIVLDSAVSQDRTLVAMPHLDDNNNNAYDFPGADGPYTSNGAPVTDAAQITIVEDMTPSTPVTVTVTPAETPTPQIVTQSPPPSPTPRERTVVRTREVTRTVVQERTVTITPTQTPGFGIAIAVVALLAAALLAVRRRE